MHLISQNRTSEHHGKEVGHFNILMKLRYALQLSVLFGSFVLRMVAFTFALATMFLDFLHGNIILL